MKLTFTRLLVTTVLATGIAIPTSAQANGQIGAGTTSDPTKPGEDDNGPDETAARRDDIVVTGTRIVSPNYKSAAPILTVTAADIAAQGAITIEEVLNRLPQVAPNAEQSYNDGDGRQRVKLRNLGYERTLTLVDGLRMGLQNGLDVGIIPGDLVERIDVLSGGASSVYGSDAVAGVINYVMKSDFDGINLSGNYNFFNHDNRENAVTAAARKVGLRYPRGMTNDGARGNATLAVGKSLFDGMLNVSAFGSYRFAELLRLGERSTAACEVVQSDPKSADLNCSPATYTQVGTIIPLSGQNANQILVNNPDGSGTFLPRNSPGTFATPYDTTAYQRELSRINAGGFVTLKLSDAFEVHTSTLYYRSKSQTESLNQNFSRLNYVGQVPYQVNCDNPFLSASQAQVLCATRAGTSTSVPIDVRFRFDSIRAPAQRYVSDGFRQTLTFRGALLDNAWHYDISGMYSRNTSTTKYRSSPDRDRTARSLLVANRNGVPTCLSVIDGKDPACVPFNAFRPYNASQELQDYLYNAQDATEGSVSRLIQGLATVSGNLGKYGIRSPLSEDGVAIALGTEFRQELFRGVSNQSAKQQGLGPDRKYTQNIWEANVEVQVPLVQDKPWTRDLQINAGYRVSKYNRLESHFATWKVEGIWAPIDDITFRGSFNKSQRAPTVIEAQQALDVSYSTGSYMDPCASSPNPDYNPSKPASRLLPPTASLAACQATGLPANLYGSESLYCLDGCTIRGGGSGLTPETAYTKTFGVILQPRFLPGLSVSLDRFLIDLEDSIGYSAASDYLNGCLSVRIDYFCRGVIRNPGTGTLSSPTQGDPTAGFILQGTRNGYRNKTHGWDIQGSYALGLGGAGKLNFGFNGSLATLFGGQDTPDSPQRRCQGYLGRFCGEGFPKWSHGLNTTYTTPDEVAQLYVNWRYVGPMTYTSQVTNPSLGLPVDLSQVRSFYDRMPAFNYMDVSASFNVAKRFVLRFSVNNLFDKDPPIVPGSRAQDFLIRSNTVFRYDLLGRQINVGASVKF
ncbi:TonB-dependent receptor domain-containing protein [Sphingomonas mollis]|uniref:TonB-dependent receptor n=1 Tax=Sphingomonas mollis TaxID=2795726 RepID=A0ABS0XM74_9SPHN|nr:TonB-dependent receptor [Sphingomonas sp. BT553]MBJ6120875.1 TonB-dependent receptor [Sphingomonas sp. BT553]